MVFVGLISIGVIFIENLYSLKKCEKLTFKKIEKCLNLIKQNILTFLILQSFYLTVTWFIDKSFTFELF